MMKYHKCSVRALLVALAVSVSGSTVHGAADFHLILAGDHGDPDLGEGFEANTNALAGLLIPSVAPEQLKITEVSRKVAGSDSVWQPLTAEMLRTAIRRVPVDRDDTLIVYIACHGYFDPAAGNYFAFAGQKESFSRQSIIREIQARNPRLGGIITDTCQNYKRMPLDEESQQAAGAFQPGTAALWQSLLFEHEGFLDWSAAQQGQFAVYYNNYQAFLNVNPQSIRRISSVVGPGADPPYKGTWRTLSISSDDPDAETVVIRGGLFTESFVSVATENLQRRLNWSQLHELVKERTSSEYRKEVPNGKIDVGGFFRDQPDQTVTLTTIPSRAAAPPSPAPPTDPARFEIAGRWQCSCGDIWNLKRNGNKVTGTESNAQRSADVSGTFDGREFRFRYLPSKGTSGSGVMVPEKSGRRMNIRIAWDNGVTTTAVATRIAIPHNSITGRWRCSCGQIWTLQQQGTRVTGSESDGRGGANRVFGTFNGQEFVFSYADPRKGNGSGVFQFTPATMKMSGRIDWPETLKPSLPTLTFVGSN